MAPEGTSCCAPAQGVWMPALQTTPGQGGSRVPAVLLLALAGPRHLPHAPCDTCNPTVLSAPWAAHTRLERSTTNPGRPAHKAQVHPQVPFTKRPSLPGQTGSQRPRRRDLPSQSLPSHQLGTGHGTQRGAGTQHGHGKLMKISLVREGSWSAKPVPGGLVRACLAWA